MTDQSRAITPRGQQRVAFAEQMDAGERRSMLSTKDQSVLGLSHTMCIHNRSAATCEECIYGEPGNQVLADAGAMEYSERVHHRKERGEAIDPVRTSAEAFRSGFAAGVGAQREAPMALGVAAARAGDGSLDALLGAVLAARDGRISKVELLETMERAAGTVAKQLTNEADPNGRRNALAAAKYDTITGDLVE